MGGSDSEIRQQILNQLAIKHDSVSAPQLAGIQHELGMQDISRTQFRRALGALASRGDITWKRPDWGSNHTIRLGRYK